MTEWLWFIATAGGGEGGTFGGNVLIYSLVIEFGDDDVVSNLTVVTDQHPCTDDETVCYDDGELEGVETMWHRSGEKAYRAHYKNNLLHGPFVVWEQDGSISLEACYEDGIFVASGKGKCQR